MPSRSASYYHAAAAFLLNTLLLFLAANAAAYVVLWASGVSGLAWDVRPPPRVWCVGDSITHFYVPALVRLEPTWTVLDLGRGAERSDHGFVRLLGLLAENPPPEVVVLLFGANDVGARVL